jgi:hypothetical protein
MDHARHHVRELHRALEGARVRLNGRARATTRLAIVLLVLLVAACGTSAGSPTGSSALPPAATTAAPKPPPTTTTTLFPRRLPAGANTVLVLGDSVILGAQPQITADLAGWQLSFDAKVSRSIYAGLSILRGLQGNIPRVVVVHLCTNWGQPDFTPQIDRTMALLQGASRVVWVTCTPWIPAVAAADQAILSAAGRYPNVVVADWAAYSATPGYTYADRLHLRTPGAVAMAALVAVKVGAPPPVPGAPTAPRAPTS